MGHILIRPLSWVLSAVCMFSVFNPGGFGEDQHAAAIPLDALNWTPIGPAPSMDNGRTGYSEDSSGRIVAIAAHPIDPNTLYIAAAGGGVWKTVDGGASWTPLTDGQSTLFMGAIALAPSNPDVMYAGTGEANMGPSKAERHNIYYGLGVLKSIDGGGSWTLLGAAEFYRSAISKIVVDPADPPATVYVAVGARPVNGLSGNSGIWKSSDGGVSWTNTTRSSISMTVGFSDLVMDPSDHLTLYAAVGEPGGDAGNGVYVTTDGGMSWAPAGNFPVGVDNGRISIAIAASAPGTIYAAVAGSGQGGSDGSFGRLYRMMKTTDRGATWSALPNPPTNICQGSTMRTNYLALAGDYHNTLAVDPTNADLVYAGGICLVRSIAGGATGSWSSIAEGTSNGPHRDHHALAFDANNPPRLLDGNDGGIWRMAPDLSFENLNTNLQITQFVGFDLHPNDPNRAHGGTQDTGVMKYQGDVRWLRQLRGDGGTFAVNALSPNRVYAISRAGESDNNWFKRSSNDGDPNPDGTGSWGTHVSDDWAQQRKNFYPPFVLQSNSSTSRDRLLVGTDRIYETVNGATSWQPLGLDGWTATEPVDSVAAAPSRPETLYASAGSHTFASTDRGVSWLQIDVQGLRDPHFAALLVDPRDSQVLYAVRDRFDGGHVFRTTDGGQNWSDVSGNLPNLPANSVAFDADASPNILYVGTDAGVYFSSDLGATWSSFGVGLPNAQVVQLKINRTTNVLAAATHGRGVWEILLPPSASGR